MKENDKGFSGLEGLSTNIDDILEESKKIEDEKESSQKKSNSSNETEKVVEDSKDQSASLRTWLVIALCAFIFIVLAISSSNNNVQKSNSTPQYKTTNTVNQSVPSKQPSQTIAPREAEIKTVAPKVEDIYKESKPPISSNNILNIAQLRYCQAEKIRIDTSSAFVNRYSNKDTDAYNAYIADYNSRCPRSQYYEKDMSKVNKEIADRKYIIEQEGKQRFSLPSSKPSNVSVAPKSESLFTLTISATPSDATIKILNIGPKYQNGISLKPGNYQIEVSKSGYLSANKKINLEKNEIIYIELVKEVINLDNKPYANSSTSPSVSKKSISSDVEQVKTAEYKANLVTCLNGNYSSICKHNLLTPADAQQVKTAEYKAKIK